MEKLAGYVGNVPPPGGGSVGAGRGRKLLFLFWIYPSRSESLTLYPGSVSLLRLFCLALVFIVWFLLYLVEAIECLKCLVLGVPHLLIRVKNGYYRLFS